MPIEARHAIERKLVDYCRAMDRIDAALGYTVWHEDGLADYERGFKGRGWDFVDHVCRMHRGLKAHTHNISNLSIRITDSAAVSETYVFARLVKEHVEADSIRTIHGRYLDRWTCEMGVWAIAHRHFLFDFEYVQLCPVMLGETARRDGADPSYSFLA